jgi:hypothetical protein
VLERFALGREQDDFAVTVVAAVLMVLLLLLLLVDDPLPLFEDEDVASTQRFGFDGDLLGGAGERTTGDEGGEVGAGDLTGAVFVLGFFALLLRIFSSSSEDGYGDECPLLSMSRPVAPKDGARFKVCLVPLVPFTL